MLNSECHEAEESADGEGGLHERLSTCSKNPRHESFIPVPSFTLQHLPEGYRQTRIVDLVQTLSDLTVRVAVTRTSMARPQFQPGASSPYPFYDRRGKITLRTGSGRIWGVRKFTEDENKPCPCQKCVRSGTPSLRWGQVYVYTATHVVFDNFEAAETICRWGYDKEDSPIHNLEGVGVGVVADLKRDRCVLICVSCDIDLVEKLRRCVIKYRQMYANIYQTNQDSSRLVVIVSHPHGCSKMVSVGFWTHKITRENVSGMMDTKYVYTTATCSGCSGAPVYIPGKVWYTYAHSGAGTEGNYSISGWGV